MSETDPLWHVVIEETRNQDVYVRASTRELAVDDALELVIWHDRGWDVIETAADMAHQVESSPQPYWSGGPDGEWVSA